MQLKALLAYQRSHLNQKRDVYMQNQTHKSVV